jgi:hypothetical protein
MRVQITRTALGLTAGILTAAALVLIGRGTVHPSGSFGKVSQAARSNDYFAGLRVGQAQGRQEGRALQEGESLPANSRQPATDAFNAGYAAGTNDAFAGYDGGWALSMPYVVTLEEGTGQIVYRISSRTPIVANVSYYLCANGRGICQEPRH